MSSNFLIGPIPEGMRKDLKPWAIPEDSWELLVNFYQWRGRLEKRGGYTGKGQVSSNPIMGVRTRSLYNAYQSQTVVFDTQNSYFESSLNTWSTLPSTNTFVWSGTDYQFFWTTNYAGGFWATNSRPGLNGALISNIVPGTPNSTITTSAPHGFTTGQFVTLININGNPKYNLNGNIYQITVTGANTFTITATAGAYSTGGIALNPNVSISGQDGIRWYASTDSSGITWVNYNPPIDTLNALGGALLIFAYRGYLVFLNTWEGNTPGSLINYPNRARWTQIGTPYYCSPVPNYPSLQTSDPTAARDDFFGKGGASDAPTGEVIVGAEFVRDILIVYFQQSTWRFRFVNNTQNPFVWERINRELGSDCTFSTIPFDKGVMGMGTRGIVMSDGNDTIRFDEKIPDTIFDIRKENNGLQRVCGIRTFRTRLCYWTFPYYPWNPTGTYPNAVLVFNYETKTWSLYDDSFTTFGYYIPAAGGKRWVDYTESWASLNNTYADNSISQGATEQIMAGNQQGYVFLVDQTDGTNDPSLSIFAITNGSSSTPATFTSNNHNLVQDNWIQLSGITGTLDIFSQSLNGVNAKVASYTTSTITLEWFAPVQGPTTITGATSYTYTTYQSILPGSVQIIVTNGTPIIFTDSNFDGNLYTNPSSGNFGTINYTTGLINLTFAAPTSGYNVYIYVVSVAGVQQLVPLYTTGSYTGSGQITYISIPQAISKVFNFFKDDQRARLSRIDFYVDKTTAGQFTVNVYGDSYYNAGMPINEPISDNPQSNIVLTSTSPYQVGSGDETIYRLYCDATAQTLQVEITLSDYQAAVSGIYNEDMVILAMIFNMRKGGRLV